MKSMESKFIIYGIYDIREPGWYRYVGQTTKGLSVRSGNHLSQAKRGNGAYVYNWIRNIGAENVRFAILQSLPGPELLNESEAYWIAKLRLGGHKLTNIGDGGDSVWSGGKRPAQSQRMAGESNPMFGKDRSEEMRHARSFQNGPTEKMRKGLSERSRGTGNPKCVLTEKLVIEMRSKFETGAYTKAALGLEYGVSAVQVGNIVTRKAWKHID